MSQININNENLEKYSKRFSKIVRENNENLKENKQIIFNGIKTLKLNTYIFKPKYNEANIINFLSFLNNTICIPDNLRIVCHSHIMQELIDNLNVYQNNDLKTIFKNENLWSIFINLYNDKNKQIEKKISISRHGFSFANLIKEKKKSLMGKIEQKIEKDAKLSLYGILTALLHGNDLVEKEEKYGMTEKPHTIFVSVLIRTWMTAICLYLPHFKNNYTTNKSNFTKSFTLIVSPFIKESGLGLDNEPDTFDNQVLTITNFLNYLIKMSDVTFSRTRINNNLLKIKNFFLEGNILNIVTVYKSLLHGETTKEIKFFYNYGLKYNIYSRKRKFFDDRCLDFLSPNVDIKNIEIFHGEYKPLKQNIDTKFTRWCEPFSRKDSFTNSKSLCKSRLSKNIKNNHNLNNIVFNNNEINLQPREALYKPPIENLKFLNLNNPANNNNIRKYLEEENKRKKLEKQNKTNRLHNESNGNSIESNINYTTNNNNINYYNK